MTVRFSFRFNLKPKQKNMACRLPKLRIVHFSDVYELRNLSRLQTLIARLNPSPAAVVLGGDFLSPSALSSLDGGKGMVATLRAIGVTHAMLGNHEADLPLHVVERRLRNLGKSVRLLNSNINCPPDSEWFSSVMKSNDIIQTPCKRVKVALGGFLTDEEGVFRDNTFRGGLISNVETSMDTVFAETVKAGLADVLIPVTHQSIARDRQTASHLLQIQPGAGLILGGHEHTHFDETIEVAGQKARILKGVSDAEKVHVVDLTFDTIDKKFGLVDIETDLMEVPKFDESVVVQRLVDSHLHILEQLKNETILDADELLPPGIPLSSEKSRYRQTTVGGVLCQAVKQELHADVAVINGATIKGGKQYPTTKISYEELSKELPFPTKMVLVEMTRKELQEAIFFSRTNPPTLEDGSEPERKGFLQVDVEFDQLGSHTGDQNEVLVVAVPRNLLKGFCQIQPLMDLGERLDEEGKLNLSDDDFLPAIDLVVRHFSRERWYDIIHDSSFNQLDRENKGFLSRNDVKVLLKNAIGRDPPAFLVDDVMSTIDSDENGRIDQGEFSHVLAHMERQQGTIKFY